MRRYISLSVMVLACWLLSAGRVHSQTEDRYAVSVPDRAAIRAVIQELYKAYEGKNIDRVMELEKTAIEESAKDAQRRGKAKPEDVRKAFRDSTEELLNHPKFSMKPLQMEDMDYRRVDNTIVVSSQVPIIATEWVKVGNPTKPTTVRLRIGQFVFQKNNGAFQIVKMYFY